MRDCLSFWQAKDILLVSFLVGQKLSMAFWEVVENPACCDGFLSKADHPKGAILDFGCKELIDSSSYMHQLFTHPRV